MVHKAKEKKPNLLARRHAKSKQKSIESGSAILLGYFVLDMRLWKLRNENKVSYWDTYLFMTTYAFESVLKKLGF